MLTAARNLVTSEAGNENKGNQVMTNISQTDISNLTSMVENLGAVSAYKGHGRGMRKMIDAGLVTKHVWGGKYVWQITAKGRAAVQ